MPPVKKPAAVKTVTAAEVFIPAPPEEVEEVEVKAPVTVVVTYEGTAARVEHTLTGKVFEPGTKHRMTDAEALDLQMRARGEPFAVREAR